MLRTKLQKDCYNHFPKDDVEIEGGLAPLARQVLNLTRLVVSRQIYKERKKSCELKQFLDRIEHK